MFDFLSDKTASLMIRLSAENREVSREELASADMRALYELCLEHELHGVVASHILNDGIAALPDYWLRAYEKEQERLEFLKKKSHSSLFSSLSSVSTSEKTAGRVKLK